MHTVGIDVSKGKSMIAVMRSGGEEVFKESAEQFV